MKEARYSSFADGKTFVRKNCITHFFLRLPYKSIFYIETVKKAISVYQLNIVFSEAVSSRLEIFGKLASPITFAIAFA